MSHTQTGPSSPIFTRTYDFMQWLIPCTLNFPKSQRGVLARQIQSQLFTFYELLVDAAMSDRPEPILRQADAALTKLRTYLRLSRDLKLLKPNQYQHVAEFTVEIGRLLGGWLKKAGARPA